MRRVVITGLGTVSPLGCGVDLSWNRLVEGKSGIVALTDQLGRFPSKVAGRVPRGTGSGQFDLDQCVSKSLQSTTALFTHFALAAADQALRMAQWNPDSLESRHSTGVSIGSGIGSMAEISYNSQMLLENGYNKISPYFLPRVLSNMAAANVSIKHGFGGPLLSASSACVTGSQAIGDAFRAIQHHQADVMLAGSSEACIDELSLSGFCRCKALSTKHNDSPVESSRPFDSQRDGFVLAEGAAMLVLEERQHALQRGAPIYAELIGYGCSSDATHLVNPSSDGNGAARAMTMALHDARIPPNCVDYINAHATSTLRGDASENLAIKRVFGAHAYKMAISSTKGATGHLLGASGSLEALFCVQSLRTQIAPPTLNLHTRTVEFDLNYVAMEAQNRPIRVVLNNSSGFGGVNSCLVFCLTKE